MKQKDLRNKDNYNRISKFISLVLRHSPEIIGITLDKNGWTDTETLIKKLYPKFGIDLGILKEIVASDNKQRYSFSADFTKIRANQGHSVSVDLELLPQKPPAILYHGTAQRFVQSIYQKGIQKQNRQYVHLSKDLETAQKVGSRHGEVFVFQIDTCKMLSEGYLFYLSENGVWLTDEVPSRFLSSYDELIE
ncbi:RNA 2'-phosphotransferase [Capnocytophaga stomatis]|uniref:RNA 2'-phosphotransferase n=1 Tax=Capnocytophaga stomatis TaxID=1848904 RepID=UPI001AD5AF0C|nr:RNA 2'-phosphotransferase [Capnocytophaga stomatis]GIM49702.1 putative RNA 2'-phosphotransferase [Capnocytophaga stomatis]